MRYAELLNLIIARRSTVLNHSRLVHEKNIYSHVLQPIFTLDQSVFCDMFGFAFSGEQNIKHPYLRVGEKLMETDFRDKDKGIHVLTEFYHSFQPSTTLEAFSKFQTRGVGLTSFQLPWEEEPNKRDDASKLGYSGPRTSEQIVREFKRIENVLKSIKKRGYKPKASLRLFDLGHINGYFLRKDNAYRFVVVHGKHRLAALIALGYNEIAVTFTLGRPRVVDMNDYESFPGYVDGSFSEEDIKNIIRAFFP